MGIPKLPFEHGTWREHHEPTPETLIRKLTEAMNVTYGTKKETTTNKNNQP